MVLHTTESSGYEVGILTTGDHNLSVQYPGGVKCPQCEQKLPTGGSWTLQIINSSATSAIPPYEKGHSGRRPDSQLGQSDFSWIIDLEGKEFHNKKLTLEPGHLKPIIHLPIGKFFTQYKSFDLQRRQGKNGNFSNFGFVPETVALHVDLQPGQELVLKDDGSGDKVFDLSYDTLTNNPPCPSPYIVLINNTRYPATEASDFGMYYQLFPEIKEDQQYDFQANKGADRVNPLNPDPTWTVRTCCQMACTTIFLGQTTDPLK